MSQSDLKDLDLTLRDKQGTTAKEYIAERIVLTDGEVAIREALKMLVASVSASDALSEKLNGRSV